MEDYSDKVAQTSRIAKLKADLSRAHLLIDNNKGWSKGKKDIALFTFCFVKAEDDIVYMMACMSGRHDIIIETLADLITKLESKDGKEG